MTEELPDEFWLAIHHISNFTSRAKYNEYYEKRVREWNEKGFIDHSIK